MAFCIVQTMPNATQQQYDAVSRRIGMGSANGQAPPGSLAHIAGPVDGGGWCIVGEWESRQAFERFYNEQLVPALRAEGLSTDGTPPTKFDVYRSFGTGQGQESTRRAA